MISKGRYEMQENNDQNGKQMGNYKQILTV